MAKQFTYRGLSEEQLAQLELEDFVKLVPSRMRRTLKRGFTPYQKKLLEKIKNVKEKGITKPLKTHCRNMPIVPSMLGITIMVYNGKEYATIQIDSEKLGHYLGEYIPTRRRIAHSAPGVGATRSSKFIPLK